MLRPLREQIELKKIPKSSQELRVTWTEYSFVKSFIKLLTLSPCADKNQ